MWPPISSSVPMVSVHGSRGFCRPSPTIPSFTRRPRSTATGKIWGGRDFTGSTTLGAAVGSIPTNDDDTCVFASLPPARFENRANGWPGSRLPRPAERRLVRSWRKASTKASSRGSSERSRAQPASCGAPPGPVGLWSAMPATSRIPSRHTGSPMPLRDAELLARAVAEGGDQGIGWLSRDP